MHRPGYHSDDALRSELQWIRALGEHGVEVPEVVNTGGGALFKRVRMGGVPESRQVDVFEWIEGKHLGELEEQFADDPRSLARIYARVGEIAARIHEQGLAWPRPPGFVR
ncbi:MAG: phosphotransferase, partial [bacterium]|nr:phosphotransferase [bacterium]